MVNLTINGTKVSVKEGTTILDAEKQKTFRCKNIISEVINNV